MKHILTLFILILFSMNTFAEEGKRVEWPEMKNQKNAPKKEKTLGQQVAEKKQAYTSERVEARRQVMVGFGPAFLSNFNSSDTALGFQAGYVWVIDDNFDLGLKSDFAISTENSDAYMLSGKIYTNYYFSKNDISPFLGAAFGYGFASVHDNGSVANFDDAAGGFAMGLQGGVKFFRTSNVNLIVSGEYTRIFDDSSLGQPGAFLLKFALLY